MARWQPDARGRLARAALELYFEQGFEQTTVAEIAARAGLTERTFFRHFADKREVLFSGSELLESAIVDAVAEAPAGASPLAAAEAGLEAAAKVLAERQDHAGKRQAVIDANPGLQERELKKMASLARSLAAALRERGIADPTAALTAEVAIAVFRAAFERWVAEPKRQTLAAVIAESLGEVGAMTPAAKTG